MKYEVERIVCKDCPKLKSVASSGGKFNVEYVLYKAKERYLICDNDNVSWDNIMKDIKDFDTTYVPKFGKFEIEQFIGAYMKEALLITKDITDLFNMELLCEDFPFNVTRINPDVIKERLLKCFDVVGKEENIIYLKFKWEKYDKL